MGRTFELQAGLVAVGQSEHRKRAGGEIAVLIEFHAAPDRHAVAVEDDVFEPRRPAAAHKGERRPRRRLLRLRSEEHTSELQSPDHLVCRLLLEKKKNTII